jgi:UDP-N-acetylglucosamine enolpyruvyl transferase
MVAALVSGCHIQKRIALPGETPAVSGVAVKPGDEVRVGMRGGVTALVRVVEIDAEGLTAASGQRYLYADMVQLEKRQLSFGRTAALVLGTVGGTLALFVALLLAAGWEVA